MLGWRFVMVLAATLVLSVSAPSEASAKGRNSKLSANVRVRKQQAKKVKNPLKPRAEKQRKARSRLFRTRGSQRGNRRGSNVATSFRMRRVIAAFRGLTRARLQGKKTRSRARVRISRIERALNQNAELLAKVGRGETILLNNGMVRAKRRRFGFGFKVSIGGGYSKAELLRTQMSDLPRWLKEMQFLANAVDSTKKGERASAAALARSRAEAEANLRDGGAKRTLRRSRRGRTIRAERRRRESRRSRRNRRDRD